MTGLLEKEAPATGTSRRGNLPVAAAAGAVAALGGGLVWAYVMKWTGYEVGYVAWLVGGLCGIAVGVAGGGTRTARVLAVSTSFAGILFGKYLGAHFLLGEVIGSDIVGVWSPEYRAFFFDNLDLVFAPLDFLFVGLAFLTAWKAAGVTPDASGEAAPEAA